VSVLNRACRHIHSRTSKELAGDKVPACVHLRQRTSMCKAMRPPSARMPCAAEVHAQPSRVSWAPVARRRAHRPPPTHRSSTPRRASSTASAASAASRRWGARCQHPSARCPSPSAPIAAVRARLTRAQRTHRVSPPGSGCVQVHPQLYTAATVGWRDARQWGPSGRTAYLVGPARDADKVCRRANRQW